MEETQQVPNQNPITPVPPISTYPTPQPALTSKTPWILITLIVILLGLASYFGYQTYQLKQQLTIQQPTPTPATTVSNSPASTSTPIPTSDPTASWEVYTNSENGYSIKYPKFADGFTRLVCPTEELTVTTTDTGNKTSPITMPSCERGGRYEFETKTTAFIAPAPEKTKYYDIVEEDIVVGGLNAKRYTFTFTNIEDGPYPTWFTSVRINKNNKTYEIYFSDKTKLALFNQILSTFKFTN
jgi:hypothetical protein